MSNVSRETGNEMNNLIYYYDKKRGKKYIDGHNIVFRLLKTDPDILPSFDQMLSDRKIDVIYEKYHYWIDYEFAYKFLKTQTHNLKCLKMLDDVYYQTYLDHSTTTSRNIWDDKKAKGCTLSIGESSKYKDLKFKGDLDIISVGSNLFVAVDQVVNLFGQYDFDKTFMNKLKDEFFIKCSKCRTSEEYVVHVDDLHHLFNLGLLPQTLLIKNDRTGSTKEVSSEKVLYSYLDQVKAIIKKRSATQVDKKSSESTESKSSKQVFAKEIAEDYNLSLAEFNYILYYYGFQYSLEHPSGLKWILSSRYDNGDNLVNYKEIQIRDDDKTNYIIKEIVSFTPDGCAKVHKILQQAIDDKKIAKP